MRKQDARAAPRLHFSKEELQPESLEQLSAKTKQAMKKVAKPRLKAKPGNKPGMERSLPDPVSTERHIDNAAERSVSTPEVIMREDEAVQKSILVAKTDHAPILLEGKPNKARLETGQKKTVPDTLRFDTAPGRRTKKSAVDQRDHRLARTASKPVTAVGRAVKDETEAQLSKYEDDNTGLQAAHTSEQASSSALHTGKQIHEMRQNRLQHQEAKKTQTLGKHGLTFGEPEKGGVGAKAAGSSNPMSRMYQRKNIQKDYRAAKAGKKTGKAAGKTGKQAAEKTASFSEKAMESIGKKKHLLLILLLGGLIIFLGAGLSSCGVIVGAGMSSASGSYPAEEADILNAEAYYSGLESQLSEEMNHYDQYHPGYDEYVITAQKIWHDPYALISIISAYRNGEDWALSDAIPIMDQYFRWQYEKSESVTTEERYVTEVVNGRERQVKKQITICIVTLKNKNLSHSPVYTLSEEQVGLYAMYMSTLGDMEGLFQGPHCSVLKEPLEYDVPQSLLDADPKFAKLVEEANAWLGSPYVWGGHSPETSFDCSGFICWLFNETGVRNVGQLGASGLYDLSRKISEAELKPGDVIFFSGTIEGASGVTHCALYVGNGMMIHCGNPCSYYDIAHGALRNNICGYGRLYQH